MKTDQDMFDQGLGENGLSKSRFNMWRAVVAMAHADGLVVDDERHMIENYLSAVPFSDAQKKQIHDDLDKPADPAALFAAISNPEDRGMFFQFARALVWSDGDDSAQEEAILQRLEKLEMDQIHAGDLERAMAADYKDSILRHIDEDKELRAEARQSLSLGTVFKSLGRGGLPVSAVLKDLLGRGN